MPAMRMIQRKKRVKNNQSACIKLPDADILINNMYIGIDER